MNRATYAPVERRRCDGLRQIPVDVETMPAAEVVTAAREALSRHKARVNRLDAERAAQRDLYGNRAA
jgi:hypothetical protein